MDLMLVLLILTTACRWFTLFWIWCEFFASVGTLSPGRRTPRGELFHNICLETKYVCIVASPGAVLWWLALNDYPMAWRIINALCHVYFAYVAWKFKDDDRWKKRLKAAKAKVVEKAGKLVVVPVAEPVPVQA